MAGTAQDARAMRPTWHGPHCTPQHGRSTPDKARGGGEAKSADSIGQVPAEPIAWQKGNFVACRPHKQSEFDQLREGGGLSESFGGGQKFSRKTDFYGLRRLRCWSVLAECLSTVDHVPFLGRGTGSGSLGVPSPPWVGHVSTQPVHVAPAGQTKEQLYKKIQ